MTRAHVGVGVNWKVLHEEADGGDPVAKALRRGGEREEEAREFALDEWPQEGRLEVGEEELGFAKEFHLGGETIGAGGGLGGGAVVGVAKATAPSRTLRPGPPTN